MNNKITVAIVSAALVLGASASSAFAATNVTVQGNGDLSTSKVKVNSNKSAVVVQSNNSNVVNKVSSKVTTGNNKANGNVGGASSVKTGNASSTVGVVVNGSSNTASVSNCGCDNNTAVTVQGNGALSHNSVKVSDTNWFGAFQSNVSNIFTMIESKANTGDNSASHNVGNGSSIATGDADSSVVVEVNGSSNKLN